MIFGISFKFSSLLGLLHIEITKTTPKMIRAFFARETTGRAVHVRSLHTVTKDAFTVVDTSADNVTYDVLNACPRTRMVAMFQEGHNANFVILRMASGDASAINVPSLVCDISFSWGGQDVVYSTGSEIHVWSTSALIITRVIPQPTSPFIRRVQYASEHVLMAACHNGCCRLWDMRKGGTDPVAAFCSYANATCTAIAMCGPDTLLLGTDRSGGVHAFDVRFPGPSFDVIGESERRGVVDVAVMNMHVGILRRNARIYVVGRATFVERSVTHHPCFQDPGWKFCQRLRVSPDGRMMVGSMKRGYKIFGDDPNTEACATRTARSAGNCFTASCFYDDDTVLSINSETGDVVASTVHVTGRLK